MVSKSGFTDIYIEDYSKKAFVVRGETRKYNNDLKALGGKWNSNLHDGAGWIFSKTIQKKVEEWLTSGKHLSPSENIMIHTSLERLERKIDIMSALLESLNNLLTNKDSGEVILSSGYSFKVK